MVTLLENPLRVGLRQERTPEPLIMVIFGASGDLTQRKLVPAIYKMKQERRLPPELTIVGVSRRDWSHEYFREQMCQGIEEFSDGIGNQEVWEDLTHQFVQTQLALFTKSWGWMAHCYYQAKISAAKGPRW